MASEEHSKDANENGKNEILEKRTRLYY